MGLQQLLDSRSGTSVFLDFRSSEYSRNGTDLRLYQVGIEEITIKFYIVDSSHQEQLRTASVMDELCTVYLYLHLQQMLNSSMPHCPSYFCSPDSERLGSRLIKEDQRSFHHLLFKMCRVCILLSFLKVRTLVSTLVTWPHSLGDCSQQRFLQARTFLLQQLLSLGASYQHVQTSQSHR